MRLAVSALAVFVFACGPAGSPMNSVNSGLQGVRDLPCTTAAAGSPYTVGQRERFEVKSDGSLVVGTTTFTTPTTKADAPAVVRWTDGSATWELSNNQTGQFNEFNLYSADGSTFLAQFSESMTSNTGFRMKVSGMSESQGIPTPYMTGVVLTVAWDGAMSLTITDDTYGEQRPAYVSERAGTTAGTRILRFERPGTDGANYTEILSYELTVDAQNKITLLVIARERKMSSVTNKSSNNARPTT